MEQQVVEYLVECAKQGSDEAFAQLYEEAYGMVYHVCLGYLKNHEDAEDTTQEVFIKIYNSINQLTNNSTFFGWAQTVAIHKSLDKLRSHKEYIPFEESIAIEEAISGDDHMDFLPDTYIIQEEQRRILENIMVQELSDVQYQTVYMFYYNNLPIEQIAEVMEVPVGTVKTRLKNSRIKIKEGVKRYERDSNDTITVAGAFPALGLVLKGSVLNSPIHYIPFAKSAIAAGAAGAVGAAGAAASSTAGTTAAAAGTAAVATAGTSLLTKAIVGITTASVLGAGTITAVVLTENKPAPNSLESNQAIITEATDDSEILDPAITTEFISDDSTAATSPCSIIGGNWIGTEQGVLDMFSDSENIIYQNASFVELQTTLSDDSFKDSIYYVVYDENASLIYTSDYGQTNVLLTESELPYNFTNGILNPGTYAIVFYCGDALLEAVGFTSITTADESTENLAMSDAQRAIVNDIKTRIKNQNWNSLKDLYPGIYRCLEISPWEHPEYNIFVVLHDVNDDGLDDLFFIYDKGDIDPYSDQILAELYVTTANGLERVLYTTDTDIYYYAEDNHISRLMMDNGLFLMQTCEVSVDDANSFAMLVPIESYWCSYISPDGNSTNEIYYYFNYGDVGISEETCVGTEPLDITVSSATIPADCEFLMDA